MDRYNGSTDSRGASNGEGRSPAPNPYVGDTTGPAEKNKQPWVFSEEKNEAPKEESGKLSALKRPFGLFRRKPSAGGSNRFVRFLKKYWYVVVLLVVVIGGLIAWRAYEANIDATWDKAADYYGRADYANASKLLKDMPVPTDEKRLTVYAQTMLATRQLDNALPAYEKLYEAKKDPAVKIVIGNIYNEQKKYDEAAKVYKDLIAANGSYVQAYVNLATLYKLQNKSQDAVDTAKQGVKANPNSVVLHELLISMLLDNKNSDDYKQAVATLKKINPQDPIFESIKE